MGRDIIFSSPEVAFSDDDYADPSTKEELDDDEYYDDGYRSMNEEEEEAYHKAIKEHDGFGDIPTFHKVYPDFGGICPCNEPYDSKVEDCAKEAIKNYNCRNATNYEFVKVVKLNGSASRGILYYITFEAKQIETHQEFSITTFEAQVLAGLQNHIEVSFCRLKASTSN